MSSQFLTLVLPQALSHDRLYRDASVCACGRRHLKSSKVFNTSCGAPTPSPSKMAAMPATRARCECIAPAPARPTEAASHHQPGICANLCAHHQQSCVRYGNPLLKEPTDWGVHFAGTETERLYGHCEGAILSGKRAALEVVNALGQMPR